LDGASTAYQPPADLASFLAKSDTRPIVYIGFGSIVVKKPNVFFAKVIKSAMKANVRVVLATGWIADTRDYTTTLLAEIRTRICGESCWKVADVSCLERVTNDVYMINEVPHDWLFERVDAVVHHGGAGTTAAGLRAGKPTLIGTILLCGS
jgi:UDP:flavonoid glycosyltransferase YjiC (YdhE family)